MNQMRNWVGRLLLAVALTGASSVATLPAWADDAYWGTGQAAAPSAAAAAEHAGAANRAAADPVVIDPEQEVAFDTPEAIQDYQLSVGDSVAVNLWATDLRFSQTYTIPFEGRLYIPSLGEIVVNKKTTAQVESDLLKRLGGRIHGLKASVLLVKTRRINAYVTGLVAHPGIVTIPPLSRLSAVLSRVGGILPEGSWRRIAITHASGKVESVDWYQFINRGNLKANPRLEAGDVVNVPPLANQVSVAGAVFKPGEYEVLPGETIKDLLFWAHGTSAEAAMNKASIAHWLTDVASDRKEQPLDLSQPGALATKLQNRDRVYIPTNTLTYIPLERTKASVQGMVNKEGLYTLTIGQTLRDLLAQAGGPKPDAGLRDVAIFHKAASGGTAQAPYRIVNAYKLLYENDESQNVQLQDGDLVMVPSNKQPIEDSVVNVQGQVAKPGRVPFRVGARLSDYINAAGGPLAKANLRHVSVTRAGHAFNVDAYRILREGHNEGDMELQVGDIVNVPETFFYFENAGDIINLVLAGIAVWAAVRPLTGR